MSPLASFTIPISVDHPLNAELTTLAAPIERHHNVSGVRGIYSRRVKGKRPTQFVAGENNAREIAVLQPIDQTLGNCSIAITHIKRDVTTVSADKNVAGLRHLGKFLGDVKAGLVQERDDVDGTADRGEAVIGNEEDIGGIANSFLFQRTQYHGQVAINRFDGSERFGRPRGMVMF